MLVFSALHSSRGAVAQLGERLNGIQEVVGSIPIGSTKNSITSTPIWPAPILSASHQRSNTLVHKILAQPSIKGRDSSREKIAISRLVE
jgi:hypothetical protein